MYSQIPRRYDSGSDTNGYADIPRRPWGGTGATGGTNTGAAVGPVAPTTPANPYGSGTGVGGSAGIGTGGQYAHGQAYDPTPGTGSMGNGGTINFGAADQEGRGRNYDAGINVYHPNYDPSAYQRPQQRPMAAFMLAPGYSPTLPNNPGGASEDSRPGGIGYGGNAGGGNVRPRPGAGGGGRPNMQPLVGNGNTGNRPAIAPAVVGGWDNPMFNRSGNGNTSGNSPRMGYNGQATVGYYGSAPSSGSASASGAAGRMLPGGTTDWLNVGRNAIAGGSSQPRQSTPATGGRMMPLGAVGLDAEGEAAPRMMPLAANGTVNGQVSGGGWTPAPIPSAQPINISGLVGAITSGQQQAANQAAQQAANAAAAPGIIRIPQPGYFGNSGIGFGAGTSNSDIGGINMYGGGGRLYGDPINGTNWAGDLPQYATQQPAPYFGPSSPGYAQYVASQNGSSGSGSGAAGGTTPAPITYDPNNPLGSIFGSFQQAQDSALAANEQRYQDTLAGWQDTYNMALGDINNLGEQQREDVRTDYMRQGEELKSSLVDRGMSNTTVRDTMLAGNLTEQENSLNRLEDSLIRERMNIALPLRTGMLGFMERREDQYPDMGQLMQLAQMLGMSGNGAGGGGGTNYGAISAAMQGVGNVGALPGAGGFAGGFGGANGNMGNVWGGQGGGGQGGGQIGQFGQFAALANGLKQNNVAPIGMDAPVAPFQQQLAASQPNLAFMPGEQINPQVPGKGPGLGGPQGKDPYGYASYAQGQEDFYNQLDNSQSDSSFGFGGLFDSIFDYGESQNFYNNQNNLSYYDPYQGYYSDPYSTPYDYSNSPGYYS